MRITLVVPGLLALPAQALARERSLSRIAAVAQPVDENNDVDAAILADVPLAAAPAPLAALGAGIDTRDRWTIRADPVAMVVGRDDARIERGVFDLDDSERAALLALLNRHFADDGVTFLAPRADAWFATLASPQSLSTTTLERARARPLRALLPTGEDAARWRRWLTESQMLLHEHPLASRPGAAVSSLWFHGGGMLPPPDRVPSVTVQAHGGRHADLVRGLARLRDGEARHDADLAQALRERRDTLIALAPVDESSLHDIAARFIAPAIDAVDSRAASSFKLIATGEGVAASWTAQPASWLARWTRRTATFVAPDASR